MSDFQKRSEQCAQCAYAEQLEAENRSMRAALEPEEPERPTLDELFVKHGTDKSSLFHNYASVYERYFAPLRHKKLTLVEIGVYQGASIRAWLGYFTHAFVYGIDSDLHIVINSERVHLFKSPAQNLTVWQDLSPDIVVDDGSHLCSDVCAAFVAGWPRLNPGGLWVVEDLHAAYDAQHNCGSVDTIAGLRFVIDIMNDFGFGQIGSETASRSDIEFVHFYKSLMVIKKKGTS